MNTFWTTIQDNFRYSDLEIRRIQYTLLCISSELSKMLLLLFLFAIFGKSKEYLVGICVLCSLRTYSGGMHMKHYWSCLLCSFIVIFPATCLLPLIPLTDICKRTIIGVCCIITYIIGPIPSKQRPLFSYSSWKKFRMKSILTIGIYFVIALLFPKFTYMNIVVWTISIQTLQLIITNFMQKGEQRYEKPIK